MTIGKSGSKIVDDIARAKSRAQAEERRERAAAKKRAGRAAIKSSRGRGMVAKSNKSGAGARGLVAYAMDKKNAKLLVSNAGTTKSEIIKDLRAAAAMRPGIKTPFGHISFSLPPTTKIDAQKWIEIADFARQELELDDAFPFAVVRHNDTDHDHIHLIFSRVSFDGRVNSDSMIGLRLAALEDQLEDRFDLPLIPRPADPAPPLKKGEIEKALRTGFTPERMQLFQIVHAAAEGSPTVIEFVKKCAAKSVVVRPNIASTGKLNGFSFSLRGSEIEFKGSQLKASWSDLQKKGVHYEQDRDAERLAALASAVADGQREFAAASAGKMEDTQQQASNTDQTTERIDHARSQDHREAEATDRATNARTGQNQEPRKMGTAMQRYLELRARDDARRVFLADLADKLKADPRPAAHRLADQLDASKTDRQIAEIFIASEKCSSESRALIKMLKLSSEDEAAVLAPYRAQIEIESYNRKRMHDAEKNAPTPSNNPSDLPTFGG